MKARYMIENPESIETTLKLTMTVKEWESLRDALENKGDVSICNLTRVINDLLSQARKVLYPTPKE